MFRAKDPLALLQDLFPHRQPPLPLTVPPEPVMRDGVYLAAAITFRMLPSPRIHPLFSSILYLLFICLHIAIGHLILKLQGVTTRLTMPLNRVGMLLAENRCLFSVLLLRSTGPPLRDSLTSPKRDHQVFSA